MPVEIIVGNFLLAMCICKGIFVSSPDPVLKTLSLISFSKISADLNEKGVHK